MICKKCGGNLDKFDDSTFYCSYCHQYFDVSEINVPAQENDYYQDKPEMYDDSAEGRRQQKLDALKKMRESQNQNSEQQSDPNSRIYENTNFSRPENNGGNPEQTSVILGIISIVLNVPLFCCTVGGSGLIGTILSIIGIVKASKSKPVSSAGLVLNIISLIFGVIATIFFVLFLIGLSVEE